MENEYGFINDGKIYLNSFLDFPEREIGKVLLTDEKAIEYFSNRFSLLTTKCEELERGMHESSNKGSFLMKIVHLKKALGTFNALGDFISLFNRLDSLQESLQVDVNQNRVKNLQLKKELLARTEALIERKSYQNDEEEIKEIHQYWLRVGRVTEGNEEQVEGAFKTLVDQFFERKREAQILEEQLIYDRLDRFRELLEEGRELFYLRKYADNKSASMKLQQEWKRVGSVPRDKFFKLNKISKN